MTTRRAELEALVKIADRMAACADEIRRVNGMTLVGRDGRQRVTIEDIQADIALFDAAAEYRALRARIAATPEGE